MRLYLFNNSDSKCFFFKTKVIAHVWITIAFNIYRGKYLFQDIPNVCQTQKIPKVRQVLLKITQTKYIKASVF